MSTGPDPTFERSFEQLPERATRYRWRFDSCLVHLVHLDLLPQGEKLTPDNGHQLLEFVVLSPQRLDPAARSRRMSILDSRNDPLH